MENLILTESSIFSLQIIRKWTKFLSIVMFVTIGLMVLAGIGMGVMMGTLNSLSANNPVPMPGGFIAVIYILMALVYFFPVLYLFRFSQYLGNALAMGNSEELTSAFLYLKKHYNFIGILMIIFLILTALGIIVAIIAGIFGLMATPGGGEFSQL